MSSLQNIRSTMNTSWELLLCSKQMQNIQGQKLYCVCKLSSVLQLGAAGSQHARVSTSDR